MSDVLDELKNETGGSPDGVGKDLELVEKKSETIAEEMAGIRKSVDRHAAGIKNNEEKIAAILKHQGSAEFKTQMNEYLEKIKKEQEKNAQELKGQVEHAKAEAEEIKQLFINQHRASTSGKKSIDEDGVDELTSILYKSLELAAVRANGGGFNDDNHRKSLEFSDAEIKSWSAASGLIEQKTISTLAHQDLGILMLPPTVFTKIIEKQLLYYSDLIEYIDMQRIPSYQAKYITQLQHGTASWGDELVQIQDEQTPTYGEGSIDVHRLQYKYDISFEAIVFQKMNLINMIEKDMARAIALRKDEALVRGSGIKKPRGFYSHIGIPGGIQVVKNGEPSTITNADFLIETIQAFDPQFRRDRKNFRAIMNSLTSAALQVLKDNNGMYLLRTLQDQDEFRLWGKPIIENEFMDDIAANSYPIVFADWKQLIQGVMPTRAGIQITDKYTKSDQGQIVYLSTMYFGAAVVQPLAARAVQIAE